MKHALSSRTVPSPTTTVLMNGLFLRTGHYARSYGNLAARTTDGNWWSATAGSATHGRYLGTWTGYVYAQNNYSRGLGLALRCGATCNAVTSSTIQQ